ncbi:cation diffusion facilitator family transporter [Microbacterium sp. AK031]|uniref:cation diffusion facilitator family transporter n=1 Tax=Microbacterium sp. AK031 TaxID=2723076 RepID=UPI00216A1351|nr:cation transporter [Microbacterium sp. AK031]MCS3844451.1 divalent metal cation (Fe/Co/Zn/Cd) transporter [Microbacterium sp. AK031]
MSGSNVSADARRHILQRRIRWIVTATIVYNLIEAVVAITAGTIASSAALIGFGLDSTIEVLSAAAVAWQFTRRDPERWEKGTLRVIAVAFFALAIYVSASSVLALLVRVEVEHSPVGIAITALSVVIMPFLSCAERRAGKELGSATAIADSKQTLLCTYLSAAVLIGLVLNSVLGWWWADAIAGLVIAGFAVREGVEAWRGDACATSVGMLLDEGGDPLEHRSPALTHASKNAPSSPSPTAAATAATSPK